MMIDDDDEHGAIGGMLGRGTHGTQRKPAPVQPHLPQITHDLTRTRTRAAMVASPQLTASAMAGPQFCTHSGHNFLRNTVFR
jgi:hypothetical protein